MKKVLTYLRFNFMSILLTVVSFMSVTLAWFAYSGLSEIGTTIDVKAWQIELNKNGQTVSNEIEIALTDIYPGMNITSEEIIVKNLGDSDAKITYKINSARILGDSNDQYFLNELETNSEFIEDVISHNYPFKINIALSKNHALSKGDEAKFIVTVSWPLDSDQDELDSQWGNSAYLFQQDELNKKTLDPTYEIQSSVHVVISLTAEQLMRESNTPDLNYTLGEVIYYNPVIDQFCEEGSSNCLKTYVIDYFNKYSNTEVKLLPDPSGFSNLATYYNLNTSYTNIINTWESNTKKLELKDLLDVISIDIIDSTIIRDGLSDDLIGFTKYANRIDYLKTKVVSYDGYFKFKNNFPYLLADTCYWINEEYNSTKGFAYQKQDQLYSTLKGINKTNNCNVIPIIIAQK